MKQKLKDSWLIFMHLFLKRFFDDSKEKIDGDLNFLNNNIIEDEFADVNIFNYLCERVHYFKQRMCLPQFNLNMKTNINNLFNMLKNTYSSFNGNLFNTN